MNIEITDSQNQFVPYLPAIIKSVLELYEDGEITIAGLFPACSWPA